MITKRISTLITLTFICCQLVTATSLSDDADCGLLPTDCVTNSQQTASTCYGIRLTSNVIQTGDNPKAILNCSVIGIIDASNLVEFWFNDSKSYSCNEQKWPNDRGDKPYTCLLSNKTICQLTIPDATENYFGSYYCRAKIQPENDTRKSCYISSKKVTLSVPVLPDETKFRNNIQYNSCMLSETTLRTLTTFISLSSTVHVSMSYTPYTYTRHTTCIIPTPKPTWSPTTPTPKPTLSPTTTILVTSITPVVALLIIMVLGILVTIPCTRHFCPGRQPQDGVNGNNPGNERDHLLDLQKEANPHYGPQEHPNPHYGPQEHPNPPEPVPLQEQPENENRPQVTGGPDSGDEGGNFIHINLQGERGGPVRFV